MFMICPLRIVKTPFVFPFSAYNSKTSLKTPIFYYSIMIGMFRYNFSQSGLATLNFRKFKVALELLQKNVFNLAKSCILTCQSLFNIKTGGHWTVFELILPLKRKIKGVLNRFNCCFGIQ